MLPFSLAIYLWMMTSTKKAFGTYDSIQCATKGTYELGFIIVYSRLGDIKVMYNSIEKMPGYLSYTNMGATHKHGVR